MKVNDWGALQLEQRCETGKISYLNQVEALVALSNAKAAGRHMGGAYRCPVCQMWHHTRKGFKAHTGGSAASEKDGSVCSPADEEAPT